MFTKTSLLTYTAFLCFIQRGTLPALAKTTYTPQECATFEALNFDIFNYADYDKYFDEDTKLTLAQTGVYQGPKEIKEYVRFTDVTSPYVDGKMLYSKTSPNLISFDPAKGVCQFTIYSTQGLVMNNVITQGGNVNFGAITKIYYSIPDNNIQDVNIYYTDSFLSEFFGRLDTYEVHEYVCGILTGPSCEYANSFNDNMKSMKCMKKLSKLPLSEGDGYMDSNTLGCRALQAVFAETNPAYNCAHLSFTPVEDPSGKTKCQISENISQIDLFSQDEIYQLQHYCEKQPEVGSKLCVKVFEAPETPDEKGECQDKQGKKGQFKVVLDGKKNQKLHNCKWAASNPDERCELELKSGGFVHDLCPKTCSSCSENK